MKPVVVVGGYGRLGTCCARQLLRSASAEVVIAGPSVQRAEATAAALGSRAQGAYLDATDSRTLPNTAGTVAAYLVCCPGLPLELLSHAIESRTPLIAMTPTALPPESIAELAERSWEQETPLILRAGWAPGLAGVLAEVLTRSYPALDEIRIASTGPDLGSVAAREDWRKLLAEWRQQRGSGSRRRMLQFGFPEPVGARRVVQVPHADLRAFTAQHTISQLSYYEQDRGLLARGYRRLTRREDSGPAAILAAEAFEQADSREPIERLSLRAANPLEVSAWVIRVLLRNLELGKVPAGVSELREAINPGLLLRELERLGARVSREKL